MRVESRRKFNRKEIKRKGQEEREMRLAKRSANAQIKRILVLTTRQKEQNQIESMEWKWKSNRTFSPKSNVEKRNIAH